MSVCESWNFLIIIRHASPRPGSVQNQVRKFSSVFAPCKNAGAERRAALAIPALLARRPPAAAAAPIFMNSRRLMFFFVAFGFVLSLPDIVISIFQKFCFGRTQVSYCANDDSWSTYNLLPFQ